MRSYGCQQNFADSERIAGLVELMGCVDAANVTESDIIIFNTCGVRHTANERVFGNIGALKLLKRRNKALIIVFSVLNGLLYLDLQVTSIIIIIIGAMS